MAWTISGAKSSWGALSKVEKDYVFTVLTLGFAFFFAEIMRSYELPYKYIYFVGLAICGLLLLYFSFLPSFIKKYSSSIPFAGLCSNLDEWEKEKNWINFGILNIIMVAANVTGIFKSEPFWVKTIFILFFMITFFFGFLYNYRKSKIIENAK